MDIALLGTGNLAVALGRAWAEKGHALFVGGRDPARARAAADAIGHGAESVDAAELATRAAIVVVAIAPDGLDDALRLAGGPDGALTATTVVDCTNAVDYATGELRYDTGSAAQRVAELAPGARVVKALHLFAGATWPFTGDAAAAPVVALCGDDETARGEVAALVADLGGRGVAIGGLAAARQAEEAAGFVMRVVDAGANPRLAVPDVG